MMIKIQRLTQTKASMDIEHETNGKTLLLALELVLFHFQMRTKHVQNIQESTNHPHPCLPRNFQEDRCLHVMPIGSMYDIFTYIRLMFMVNVGRYASPMDPMGW